jgi:hypothetical protein
VKNYWSYELNLIMSVKLNMKRLHSLWPGRWQNYTNLRAIKSDNSKLSESV